jgi:predicted SAM-dependent methyltransferase
MNAELEVIEKPTEQTIAWQMPKSSLSQTLKRSEFILGMVRALRGLKNDFRVASWCIQRGAKIANYLKTTGTKKLHLGTSNNVLEGWLNTDIFLNSKSVVYLDATRRFPFDDATFEYVMAEHMIEHIDYAAAQIMLHECFRVLKPGGRIRLATPDLKVLLALHSTDKTEIQRRYVDWIVSRVLPTAGERQDVFVINNAFRAWGHQFLYDHDTLLRAVATAGFQNVRFYQSGVSDDTHLKGIESHGREVQAEDMVQFETMVVEASKG